MHSASTANLISRAKKGDQQAFAALVELSQNRLRVLASLRLGSKLREKVEVDDVLQETYLRAYLSLERFTCRNEQAFFQWLGVIAEHVIQNLARRHVGAQKRNCSVEVPLSWMNPADADGRVTGVRDLLAAKISSPSKHLRRDERFERLATALGKLDRDQQEAIILARIHGLPLKEVARKMSRSPDAVSMLILRGLHNLRRIFGSTESLRLPPRSLRSRFPEGVVGSNVPSSSSVRSPIEDGSPRSSSRGF